MYRYTDAVSLSTLWVRLYTWKPRSLLDLVLEGVFSRRTVGVSLSSLNILPT